LLLLSALAVDWKMAGKRREIKEKILSGADRDRTDDLLNAIYFQASLAFYPLFANA
jgi:hypothetical protein